MNIRRADMRASTGGITLITPSLRGGGSERVCVLLANFWAAEGKRVELLVTGSTGSFGSSLDARVNRYCANKPRVRGAALFLMSRLCLRNRAPILAFGLDVGAMLGFFKRAHLLRQRVVYREWNLPQYDVRSDRLWLYSGAVRYVDGIIAQTEYARSCLEKVGVDAAKCRCIPNPIHSPDNVTLSMPTEAPFRVLCVGRLEQQKGYERLLRAIAQDTISSLIASVTIAGEGSMREQLQVLAQTLGISSKVKLIGFSADMPAQYRSCDVFVMPSRYEGLPNALMEAISFGCPVIASGGGGVQELLLNVGLGHRYIDEGTWMSDFTSRFSLLARSPIAERENARQRLLKLTDIGIIASRYYEFCCSVKTQIG